MNKTIPCYQKNNNIQFAFPKFDKKTGAELVSNGIMGRDLGTKQKKTSQIQPHNAIVDKFGTSLPLNFGKVNYFTGSYILTKNMLPYPFN